MTLFRPAHADELGRAASLCTAAASRPSHGPRHGFVAVREHPVERLVASAFWSPVSEADGSQGVEFEWSAIDAMSTEEQARFLTALSEEVRRQAADAAWIAPAAWIADGHAGAAGLLQQVGFVHAGQRIVHHAEAAKWREMLAVKSAPTVHGDLEAPAPEHFEALRALVCGPGLRPAELAIGIQSAASHQPSLYDSRCSAVLVHEKEIIGACLANSSQGHLALAALAGSPDACARLLQHCLQGRDHLPEPATLSFQIDDRQPAAALARLAESFPCHASKPFLRLERRFIPASGNPT